MNVGSDTLSVESSSVYSRVEIDENYAASQLVLSYIGVAAANVS